VPGKRLTAWDRQVIENCWRAGMAQAQIAAAVGRSPATICRELRRNHSGRHGPKHPGWRAMPRRRGRAYRWGYSAGWAQRRADARARRPKPAKLAVAGPLRTAVLAGLGQRWSPQQIAARLRAAHGQDRGMTASHETIYQAIYVQSRGGLRQLLGPQVLRSGRARRVVRRPDRGQCGQARTRDRLLKISARPAEVADRAVPGHWEGDLLMGARRDSAIATLVERATRFTVLVALPDRAHHDPLAVADALATQMLALPVLLRRSLTWDRGLEMIHGHAAFSLATRLPVYFCDPHAPWQRGSNENTNGLLRQYFPKGTNLAAHSQADLDAVAVQLNGRPRQTLGWATPAEKLNQLLLTAAA
jgi:transposase, IS30 family